MAIAADLIPGGVDGAKERMTLAPFHRGARPLVIRQLPFPADSKVSKASLEKDMTSTLGLLARCIVVIGLVE